MQPLVAKQKAVIKVHSLATGGARCFVTRTAPTTAPVL